MVSSWHGRVQSTMIDHQQRVSEGGEQRRSEKSAFCCAMKLSSPDSWTRRAHVECRLHVQCSDNNAPMLFSSFFFGGGKTQLTSGWAARETRWMQINSMICAVIRHSAVCVRFFFFFLIRGMPENWVNFSCTRKFALVTLDSGFFFCLIFSHVSRLTLVGSVSCNSLSAQIDSGFRLAVDEWSLACEIICGYHLSFAFTALPSVDSFITRKEKYTAFSSLFVVFLNLPGSLHNVRALRYVGVALAQLDLMYTKKIRWIVYLIYRQHGVMMHSEIRDH